MIWLPWEWCSRSRRGDYTSHNSSKVMRAILKLWSNYSSVKSQITTSEKSLNGASSSHKGPVLRQFVVDVYISAKTNKDSWSGCRQRNQPADVKEVLDIRHSFSRKDLLCDLSHHCHFTVEFYWYSEIITSQFTDYSQNCSGNVTEMCCLPFLFLSSFLPVKKKSC